MKLRREKPPISKRCCFLFTSSPQSQATLFFLLLHFSLCLPFSWSRLVPVAARNTFRVCGMTALSAWPKRTSGPRLQDIFHVCLKMPHRGFPPDCAATTPSGRSKISSARASRCWVRFMVRSGVAPGKMYVQACSRGQKRRVAFHFSRTATHRLLWQQTRHGPHTLQLRRKLVKGELRGGRKEVRRRKRNSKLKMAKKKKKKRRRRRL